jgi:glycosyltransferase involved in cell wall biosynthesis
MLRRNSFNIKLLSVIIPAYKQEKTIVKDVKAMMKSLDTTGYNYEIIIVVDGMVDNTLQYVKEIKSSKVRALGYAKNQGKGHAVRYGMMHAKGDIIGFIDAGMDIHPAGFNMLLNHMEWYNADIIVGSKLHPASKVNYPLWRKILSRGYRLLTRMLFGFKVRDTQVGIKFFKRKVITDVLPRLLVKTYAFDIEFLAVAYSLGYQRIYEAPIEINFTRGSITKMNMWRVVFWMLWDTFAVFYRLKIMRYYHNPKFSKKPLVTTDAKISLTK